MKHGTRIMEHGTWNMEHETWNMKHLPYIKIYRTKTYENFDNQ